MRFMNLCMPALVYLVIALFGAFMDFSKNRKPFTGLVISLLVISLITYALNYVCKRYSVRTSWYVLAAMFLFPVLLAFLTVLMISKR